MPGKKAGSFPHEVIRGTRAVTRLRAAGGLGGSKGRGQRGFREGGETNPPVSPCPAHAPASVSRIAGMGKKGSLAQSLIKASRAGRIIFKT